MSRRSREYTWRIGIQIASRTFLALAVVVAIVAVCYRGPR
jgi:hypothetical protein